MFVQSPIFFFHPGLPAYQEVNSLVGIIFLSLRSRRGAMREHRDHQESEGVVQSS